MDTDRRLTRYLLGLLSDDETERLDESSIADDDIAWRLRTLENALVDSYVRGALPADIIAPFEARYLSSSARRRAKVRFAARFVRMVDATDVRVDANDAATEVTLATRRTDPSASSERRLPWTFSTRSTFATVRMSVAAALVIIVGALVLRGGLWERTRGDDRPGRIARTGKVDVGPVSEPRRQVQEPPSRVPSADEERVHGRVSELAPTGTPPDIARQPTESTPSKANIAVVLFPQTRSAGSTGDAEKTIAVPRDAGSLVLELRLDVSDFSRYAASLMDLSSHRTVWRSARIAPTSSADRPAVLVAVPAGVLASRTYAIELSGVAASGESEVVAAYVFAIAWER